ncbi:MAG: cytochrome oxidase small assembly protein [Candidatus Protistobacter heckmanni]|nr:cytochrome oxidase small assembly protein [Candidatus Protistobacter heckmanni]
MELQDKGAKQVQAAGNKRLGLILLSVVVVFFVGIVAKKMLLG